MTLSAIALNKPEALSSRHRGDTDANHLLDSPAVAALDQHMREVHLLIIGSLAALKRRNPAASRFLMGTLAGVNLPKDFLHSLEVTNARLGLLFLLTVLCYPEEC